VVVVRARVTQPATFLDRLIDERANEANQDSISYVTAGTTAYCIPCDAFCGRCGVGSGGSKRVLTGVLAQT
jgi:hypothetical protein